MDKHQFNLFQSNKHLLNLEPEFQGSDYIPKYDKKRLTGQLLKVWNFMKSGEWHTLAEISRATGAPEASASAALREFRKEPRGGHIVDKRRRGNPYQGLFEYRLIINKQSNGNY